MSKKRSIAFLLNFTKQQIIYSYFCIGGFISHSIAIFIISLFLCSSTFADHTVGNGGDPLRYLFNKSKDQLIKKINKIEICQLAESVDIDVASWILNNKYKFVEDLKKSKLVWIDDGQATCAKTNLQPQSDIYLSYQNCNKTVGLSMTNAMFTLLHETTHHFDVADEYFADKVATAILESSSNAFCGKNLSKVFNPNICLSNQISNELLSKKLKENKIPKGFSLPLAKVKPYQRSRLCNKTICKDWSYSESLTLEALFHLSTPYDDNTIYFEEPILGLSISESNDDIFINLKSNFINPANYEPSQFTFIVDDNFLITDGKFDSTINIQLKMDEDFTHFQSSNLTTDINNFNQHWSGKFSNNCFWITQGIIKKFAPEENKETFIEQQVVYYTNFE